MRDLMKKGLKRIPGPLFHNAQAPRMNERPDEEGIETKTSASRGRARSHANE